MQLRARLTAIPDTPGALRKTLSSDNVKKFMEIVTSTKAIEADWLFLCGDLTEEQAEQYQMVTGDRDMCKNDIADLAIKISAEVRSNLMRLINNDLRGEKKAGLYNFFRSIIDLYLVKFKSLDDLKLNSTQLGDRFIMQTMAIIGADLIDMLGNKELPNNVREFINSFIEYYRKVFFENKETDFYGIQFHNERSAYKETLYNILNASDLDRTINFTKASDPDKLTIENESFFAQIKKEALYKKMPFTTFHDEQPQIIFMKNDPSSGFEYGTLGSFRINFNKDRIGFPEFQTNSKNEQHCNYGIFPGIINFSINPETGDLCFITSGIPLSQILPLDRYLALQNYILKKLKEYLESKEPDIEDFFAYSPAELEIQRERLKNDGGLGAEIESLDDMAQESDDIEGSEHSLSEKFENEWWKFLPNTNNQATGKDQSEQALPAMPKHFRSVIMDRISGARAEETLAALRRMLGQEERVEGDHYFFRSQRNGMILPIPQHSRKNKHHIAFKLVLNNLKLWGYNPIELALELGAKIPKKVLEKSN